MATFNSKEYSWADISIFIAGRKVVGARSIKYKEAKEKEFIHASGDEPRGIGHGNKTYEGELILLQSEYEALEDAAGGSLLDVTLDIIVAYSPKTGGLTRTDALKFAEITEAEKGMAQNDKYAEITLPLMFLGIDKNI